jgi:hypothetical protein
MEDFTKDYPSYTPKQREWARKHQLPRGYNDLYISEAGSIMQARPSNNSSGFVMYNFYTKQDFHCSDYYLNFMSRPVTLDEFTEKEIFTMMLTGKVIRKDND